LIRLIDHFSLQRQLASSSSSVPSALSKPVPSKRGSINDDDAQMPPLVDANSVTSSDDDDYYEPSPTRISRTEVSSE
jgi:hypothetical protein